MQRNVIKNDINGVIVLDKPKDFTSYDCLAVIKKTLRPKKIGHTGTLDVNATGVLVCLLGNSTKCQDYLMKSGTKVYEAELILGIATDTEDITGEVIERKEVNNITRDKIEEVLKSFIGEYNQIPPMYSAKKVNGKKLLNLARKGKEVERKACKLYINDIKLVHDNVIRIVCSKGTYIRTLCKDIGERLGVPSCMGNLRRLATGDFHIEDAITLDRLKEMANENDFSFIKPCFYKEFEQVVTFGKYETLHLGHQKVIKKVVEMAKERDIESTVIIVGNNDDTMLLTDAQRISKLKYLGVDNIVRFPLNKSTMNMDPEIFIKEILFTQLKARAVVIGSDASFGKGGKGDIELLRRLGKENGVTIEVIDKMKVPDKNIDISSTYIKELYDKSEIEKVKELMG